MAILKGGALLVEEVAGGTVDGLNVTFTTAFPFVPDTLQVYLNGLKQALVDYTVTGSQSFDFDDAPLTGINPDIVEVIYQRA